jgi:hypothetical protein
MAILNAEFLSMDAGTPFKHDGGMFEQDELYKRGGPETTRLVNNLQKNFPGAATLLEQALQAQGFDDCPSPAEWLVMGNPIKMAVPHSVSSHAPRAPAQPNAAHPVNSSSFIPLDEAAFVQLDESAFVPLI